LLLGSIMGMALMSFGLAFGLDNGLRSISAAAIILFIVRQQEHKFRWGADL
jgi:hypothetical protein